VEGSLHPETRHGRPERNGGRVGDDTAEDFEQFLAKRIHANTVIWNLNGEFSDKNPFAFQHLGQGSQHLVFS
jgi:hypothetical protein